MYHALVIRIPGYSVELLYSSRVSKLSADPALSGIRQLQLEASAGSIKWKLTTYTEAVRTFRQISVLRHIPFHILSLEHGVTNTTILELQCKHGDCGPSALLKKKSLHNSDFKSDDL